MSRVFLGGIALDDGVAVAFCCSARRTVLHTTNVWERHGGMSFVWWALKQVPFTAARLSCVEVPGANEDRHALGLVPDTGWLLWQFCMNQCDDGSVSCLRVG